MGVSDLLGLFDKTPFSSYNSYKRIHSIHTMKTSQVFSLRLPTRNAQRLTKLAKRLGRSASETGAILLDEGLRRAEFAFVDFRDSSMGRQAYIQGSSLAVWEVISLVAQYKGNLDKVTKHLEWSRLKVQAAVNYGKAFPDEIRDAIEENEAFGFDEISKLLPQTEIVSDSKGY